MNKRKILFFVSFFILLIGFFGYNYLYKNHRNISEEKADFVILTSELIKEFNNKLEVSTLKYLDKTIELSGKVTEIEEDNFMLDNMIVCYADSVTLTHIKKDILIRVKGRSIGYDELLEFIKLDQVTIINH
jgi:hypothetical protein